MPVSSRDPTAPGVRTEADADARVVMPYLASIGIQPDQVRAQRTFAVKLGRNMIHSVGAQRTRTGRLDYLVVTADQRPLFVVELKPQGEELTDDDRDQGISYARLVHPIAPLVLVTNTLETRLYDTISKELLTSAGSAILIRGGGHLSADEDLRVRSEALEHFIGYSQANVATFSRLQRDSRMRALRGDDGLHTRKYEPDLYLRRDGVRSALSAFLASSNIVFTLGGRSGYGKTNEMCAMAEELGDSHVTLFFNGSEISGSLASVLTDEFNWFFSEALALPQICYRLARLADRSAQPVLIFIDAVDEAAIPVLPQELSDLAVRLDQFGGSIRLVVSAKPEEWHRFALLRGVRAPIQDRSFQPASPPTPIQATDTVVNPIDQPLMSALVDRFEASEHDEAIRIYTTVFGLRGRWLPPVKEIAADPFMLRMIAEVGSALGRIPENSGERELVRRYIDEKLLRTSDRGHARLELIAVAKALATGGGSHQEWGEDDSIIRFTGRAPPCAPSVPEAVVRAEAGLAATTAICDELVAFGVLVRSIDRDGRARLTFAYDRVRDYMLATHIYDFPSLDRARFRDATLACLPHGPGAAALRWYLPYVTADQWSGFVEAATRQVERLVDTYEAIRAHVAPDVRAAMEPGDPGQVGAVFAGSAQSGWFRLALFRRTSDALPRVCFDQDTFDTWDTPAAGGAIAKRLLSTMRGRVGFWFLRDPERFAAEHALTQLLEVIKDGRLAEAADNHLIAERVVALTKQHRRTLGLADRQRRSVNLFADDFVALDLFPLDLVDLRRRVQVELAFQSYQNQHMRERLDAKRREYEATGAVPQCISASSNWSAADLQMWKERAEREVHAGRVFTATIEASSELAVLAVAVNALIFRKTCLEEPLLPAPDLRDSPPFAGIHNFEDGYSDAQLARLMETIFGYARKAYDQVMAASFSDSLRLLLPPPPELTVIVCFRQPLTDRPDSQFGAVIQYGAGSPAEGSMPPVGRAVAAVVSEGEQTMIQRVGEDWLHTLVTTSAGRFLMRLHRITGLVSIVWPDAPPFVRHGSSSPSGSAPVRAMMYTFAKNALEELSPEKLLTLIVRPPAPGWGDQAS
ncbi:MAG: hypothetical protein ABR543_04580 [Gemmatimonadaceae bacterium]